MSTAFRRRRADTSDPDRTDQSPGIAEFGLMPKACPETHRRTARGHCKRHAGDGEAHVQCVCASCALDELSDIKIVRPRLRHLSTPDKGARRRMAHIPDATVVQHALSCS